jgi:hypothetical protein
VTVVVGGVGVMGNDWLAGERHGGEKRYIFLLCSSICLVNLASHARKSDLLFCSLVCCSTLKKNWKDMVMGMDR